MRSTSFAIAIGLAIVLSAGRAEAQHLWWDAKKWDSATCLYGEITVLATHPAIYYCGANWHPGEPAGGYCGIQHNSAKEKRTIFSIWDTSRKLHPKVSEADAKSLFNRFGGEGEGAHTHMVWDWQLGETFQFFVQKQPGPEAETTAARYYIYDRGLKKWRHSATITSPKGDKKSEASVATIGGGGLASFLENFSGKDRDVPKLALYRLWLGIDVDSLKCLTLAQGDGKWGQLNDDYFLADGEEKKLEEVFRKLQKQYGEPVFGQKGKKLAPISDKPLPADLVKDLKTLPQAEKVVGK